MEVEYQDLEYKQKVSNDRRRNEQTYLHKEKLKVACEKKQQETQRARFKRVKHKMIEMKRMKER